MPWQGIFDRMSNKIVLKGPSDNVHTKGIRMIRKTHIHGTLLPGALTYLSALQRISLVHTQK